MAERKGEDRLNSIIDSLILGYFQRREYASCIQALLRDSPSLKRNLTTATNGSVQQVILHVNPTLHDKPLEQIISGFWQYGRQDLPPELLEFGDRLRHLSSEFSALTACTAMAYSENQQLFYGRKTPFRGTSTRTTRSLDRGRQLRTINPASANSFSTRSFLNGVSSESGMDAPSSSCRPQIVPSMGSTNRCNDGRGGEGAVQSVSMYEGEFGDNAARRKSAQPLKHCERIAEELAHIATEQRERLIDTHFEGIAIREDGGLEKIADLNNFDEIVMMAMDREVWPEGIMSEEDVTGMPVDQLVNNSGLSATGLVGEAGSCSGLTLDVPLREGDESTGGMETDFQSLHEAQTPLVPTGSQSGSFLASTPLECPSIPAPPTLPRASSPLESPPIHVPPVIPFASSPLESPSISVPPTARANHVHSSPQLVQPKLQSPSTTAYSRPSLSLFKRNNRASESHSNSAAASPSPSLSDSTLASTSSMPPLLSPQTNILPNPKKFDMDELFGDESGSGAARSSSKEKEKSSREKEKERREHEKQRRLADMERERRKEREKRKRDERKRGDGDKEKDEKKRGDIDRRRQLDTEREKDDRKRADSERQRDDSKRGEKESDERKRDIEKEKDERRKEVEDDKRRKKDEEDRRRVDEDEKRKKDIEERRKKEEAEEKKRKDELDEKRRKEVEERRKKDEAEEKKRNDELDEKNRKIEERKRLDEERLRIVFEDNKRQIEEEKRRRAEEERRREEEKKKEEERKRREKERDNERRRKMAEEKTSVEEERARKRVQRARDLDSGAMLNDLSTFDKIAAEMDVGRKREGEKEEDSSTTAPPSANSSLAASVEGREAKKKGSPRIAPFAISSGLLKNRPNGLLGSKHSAYVGMVYQNAQELREANKVKSGTGTGTKRVSPSDSEGQDGDSSHLFQAGSKKPKIAADSINSLLDLIHQK